MTLAMDENTANVITHIVSTIGTVLVVGIVYYFLFGRKDD